MKSQKGEFIVRSISLKLATLASVIVAFAMVPAASATTLNLVNGGQVIGTVTLTQDGSNVDVSVTMNSGFALLAEGGDVGILGGVSGTSSLSNFSVGTISSSLKNNTTLGGFTFTDIFKLSNSGGQNFLTTLSFTINNATASQITEIGFHVCFSFNGTDCASTGFAETSPVPEPGTLGLLGTGLIGIAGLIRRRFVS